MTTNAAIITAALRELGVLGEGEEASAEQGAHALGKLNRMIEAWTDNDIELGYFQQSSTTAACPITYWSERAVITRLALELAPTYGATITPELAFAANEAYTSLLRKIMIDAQKPLDMSHMPTGSGHAGGPIADGPFGGGDDNDIGIWG